MRPLPLIGKMRNLVSLQSRTTGRAADGGVTHSWATDASVWARITPAAASERVQGEQVEGVATHTITLRYVSAGITPDQRILHGSTVYEILGVRFDRKRCFHFLQVAEAAAVRAGDTLAVYLVNDDGDFVLNDDGDYITVSVTAA